MLEILCWKWKPANPRYRSSFGAPQVNVLRAMVERHYQRPHRFSCITDDPAGIDQRVRIIPLWPDLADLPSPHGWANPSCFRRLKLFGPEAASIVGDRFVWLDLDVVICGNLEPVFDRAEDFVMWEGQASANPYNGSMLLMNAGARPQVWTDFDPKTSPGAGRLQGYVGSDQAWIAAKLGRGEPVWTRADGVYSWRNHIRVVPGAPLPANARIVFFHGHTDAWSRHAQQVAPWISEHWHE